MGTTVIWNIAQPLATHTGLREIHSDKVTQSLFRTQTKPLTHNMNQPFSLKTLATDLAFCRSADLLLSAVRLEKIANDEFEFGFVQTVGKSRTEVVITTTKEAAAGRSQIVTKRCDGFPRLLAFLKQTFQTSRQFTLDEKLNMEAHWCVVVSELSQSFANLTMALYFWLKRFLPTVLSIQQMSTTTAHCRAKTFLQYFASKSFAEQQVVFEQLGSFPGHPFHPMAKTKLNLTSTQVLELSPEFGATVTLNWIAVHKESLCYSFVSEETVLEPLLRSLVLRRSRKETDINNVTVMNLVSEALQVVQTYLGLLQATSAHQHGPFVTNSCSLEKVLPEFLDAKKWQPLLYNEYIISNFPSVAAQWAFFGDAVAEYVPLPVHPANVSHLKQLFQRLFDGEELLLLNPAIVVETKPLMSFRTLLPISTALAGSSVLPFEKTKAHPTTKYAYSDVYLCKSKILPCSSSPRTKYATDKPTQPEEMILESLTLAERLLVANNGTRNATERQSGMDPPHIKLPAYVQATSQLRYLSPVEAHDSPIITDMLSALCEGSRLIGSSESIGVHFNYYDDKRFTYEDSRYLSCIFRENPARAIGKHVGSTLLLPLASLFCPFWQGEKTAGLRSLLFVFLEATAQDPVSWFTSYTELIMSTILRLFLRYGVTVEAHQQNLVLLLSLESGEAEKLLYRDMAGGVYCSGPILALRRHSNTKIDLHQTQPVATESADSLLFNITEKLHQRQDSICKEGDATPLNQLIHTCLTHNLLFLVRVLCREYAIDEKRLIEIIRRLFMAEFKEAETNEHSNIVSQPDKQQFLAHLRTTKEAFLGPDFSHKCLLTMRALGTKQERFVPKANPFADLQTAESRE